jgi:predicted RNA-binding Zn ribbon-like protein
MAEIPSIPSAPSAAPPLDVGLAFVNTLEHTRQGDREHLSDEAALRAWLVDRGLLDGDGPGAEPAPGSGRSGEAWLGRALRLRAALRRLVDATVQGRPVGPDDLAELNSWLRRPAPLRLEAGPGGVLLRPAADEEPVGAALTRLALSVAGGIATGDPGRLRVCADQDCRWAFYDTSRPGSRRWCEMASCGNRAKARRHRERTRRAVGSPAGAT